MSTEIKEAVVRQGDFSEVPDFAAMGKAGLLRPAHLHMLANTGFIPAREMADIKKSGLVPQANFKFYDRQTKTVEDRIYQLAMESYIGSRILTPTPLSFFEPAREWHKEKAMGDAVLSMEMEGRSKDAIEFEAFSTKLPGFTKNWGYAWRTLGISQRTGRPLDTLTERQALRRVLKNANRLILEGQNTQGTKGLLNEVPSGNTVSAAAAWSAASGHDPYEDLRKAIGTVADEDLEVPSWNMVIHPTNRNEAARLRGTSVDTTFMQVIQREFGSQLRVVESTAIPEGTILGVPRVSDYADLLTTGLPVVVPIRADNLGVEFQARMIAVPRVIESKAFWKITGA